MGLTSTSVGKNTLDGGLEIRVRTKTDRVVAVAGNPNVGKSTIFNALTGMNQHTGNWPGKTVSNAQGYCRTKQNGYVLVDIPGTYSLMAHSAEEEIARNFICFGNPDAVIVVCDATCLERNLNLVLQTLEISKNTVVCVNLLDEAKRKNIRIDLNRLSELLGVPVIGTVARKKSSLTSLTSALDRVVSVKSSENIKTPVKVEYSEVIEKAIDILMPAVITALGEKINPRWLSLKLLDCDESLINEMNLYFGKNILADKKIIDAMSKAKQLLNENEYNSDRLKDEMVSALVGEAEKIANQTVTFEKSNYDAKDRKIDKLLTGKWVGYPTMLLLLAFIFWLTISGANYPSEMLSLGFSKLQNVLSGLLITIGAPVWLHDMLILGIYKVLSWVVAVMLPPMAIFFPLFTLLEDVGYLPRIAYNLDKPFKKCNACGKQALTMCMGFGCNAAGVIGCRIIDSPRERLIAILTNNFVPCNGRFPTLIALISIFFIGSATGILGSVSSALILTLIILLGIGITFFSSWLLSKTVLKGVPSSFTLELPPYRKPQVGKVIVRAMLDRTLFVLGRAAAVAAPAGLIIWIMANITVGGDTLLNTCANFLDPFARLLGLDGVILMAFILGFPANEIVIPIIIMAYMAQGSLMELNSLSEMLVLFTEHGWTVTTAICTMLFSLLHWPCSTTVLTIYKETKSLKWTLFSVVLPTALGILLCMLFANTVGRLI